MVGLSDRIGLQSNGGIFYIVDDVHHYESGFEYCQIAENGPSFRVFAFGIHWRRSSAIGSQCIADWHDELHGELSSAFLKKKDFFRYWQFALVETLSKPVINAAGLRCR
jgi:hypothetical protein